MSTEFTREDRYIVFKLSDVEEHFTPGEKQQLARLAEVQQVGRSEAGKPPLECVVVEADWPEYEPTWKAIEARMTGAQPAPSVPDGFSREDLEAVADGLDGYEKTVNVGNVTGEGDDHLESTTAYAARFIRTLLAAAPGGQAMKTYCLGYTHEKCGTCQHEKNWQMLNQMPDALRKSMQSQAKRVDDDLCRLTRMGAYKPFREVKP